ncbi:Arc family DNA-binding protein [Devosia sp. Root635]|uniref:Arc family DNA-binding protein n=1 Tax=Devosia sp. Root635 TaxID=1736575 RepID=UPI0009EC781C
MSRSDPQLNIRIPALLRDRLRESAEANRRSVTAEIVHYLDRALAAENENGPASVRALPDQEPTTP